MELEVIKGHDEITDAEGKTSFRPNSKAAELDPRGVEWPAGTTCVVARDNGKVVAFSAIIVLPHIEGTWVDEDHRRGTLSAKLVKKVEDTLQESGGTYVWAYAHDADPQIKTYLDRFKYERLPFSVYMKELRVQ